jgi:hypothetical protein
MIMTDGTGRAATRARPYNVQSSLPVDGLSWDEYVAKYSKLSHVIRRCVLDVAHSVMRCAGRHGLNCTSGIDHMARKQGVMTKWISQLFCKVEPYNFHWIISNISSINIPSHNFVAIILFEKIAFVFLCLTDLQQW